MHNPYNHHVAVRDDAMFFGRERILARIVQGLSDPIPVSVAVFGGRRCGKTSLLNKLVRELSRENARAAGGRWFIPCGLDLQRGRPLTCSDDFFLWILEELGGLWEEQKGLERGTVAGSLHNCYRNEIVRGPVDAFVRAFRSFREQFCDERIRLVILIDEAEQILTMAWGDDLRPNLRSLLSNSPITEEIALVMAGSTTTYIKVTERDSPLENILNREYLSALSHGATIALAREPNENRLPQEHADEVWRQTGGQPCMVQYILHELWNEFEGELADCTLEDVREVAETFDERTRHCSTWRKTLGPTSSTLYRYLVEQDEPVTYLRIRQSFSQLDVTSLRGALDALYYHGLIHCDGYGRQRWHKIAGQLYRNWFLSAGRLCVGEQAKSRQKDTSSPIIVHGDYIIGDRHTGVDQRGQEHRGPQTNIAGDASGPIASGQFDSAASVGGGKAADRREDNVSEGDG